MPTLRAPPYANFYVGRHRYGAGADGLIQDVHPDDIGALLANGCVSTDPWSAPPLRAPPRVRLKGRPHHSYQPETGHRYTADAAGFLDAAPEHVKALVRAGCVVVVSKDAGPGI